ncbi:MAG: DUF3619 family protein [Zoogloeaceae bacterium]|nr:DUF3619 family protein [Zoogloeaceae bacterium]
MTTERRIARNMTFLLDRGVDSLDAATVLRLQSARQRALDSLSAGGMPIHGAPGAWRYLLGPLARGALALMLLGAVVAGADRWKGEQQLREAIAVDAALLGDDLPIDAYLDPGFRTWLAEDAHS